MVSPYLVKKSEKPLTINSNTKTVFQLVYGKKQKSEDKGGDDIPKINVSSIVSRLSALYEKIRNAVDYEEDYLLRKNAIKRILKRQIVIEGFIKEGFIKTSSSEEISLQLLTELIQGGYLPNNKIPETKIKEISLIIEKYIKLKNFSFEKNQYLLNLSGGDKKTAKEKNKLIEWIIYLAGTEIEENLNRDVIKQAVVNSMYETLSKMIVLPNDLPYQKDLDIQIYLSIARTFLRADKDILSLVLFKYYNQGWDNAGDDQIEDISCEIDSIYRVVEKQLRHPLIKQIDKIVRRYSLYYSVLLETIDENPSKVYDSATSNLKIFLSTIKDKIEKKYSKMKSKLWRSGVRSIIYIFLTKSIFVFLLEIPATKFFGEPINPVSLLINISFPAVLLFIIILFSTVPGSENTAKILEGLQEITFAENQRQDTITLRRPRKRSTFMSILFNLIYVVAFSFSVYLLVIGLGKIDFNWVSITIFLFFLTFVSFFSFRIKREIKEFIITEQKESFLGFLFDFFYMPIVAAGKFLSDNISKVNVFVFALDFIIEAPFKVIVGVIEDWTKYIKERKENLG